LHRRSRRVGHSRRLPIPHQLHQACGRQRLQELAPVGSVVSLRPQTIDKYGRTVAEVFRGGQNVNLAMVSSGQAFAYRKYLGACDGSAYLGAEAAAQRQRVGVWAVPGGIQRPWDWRHGTRRPAPYLAGSSGRGIGATAPAGLPHPLPPRSRVLLDPQRRPWPLLAATAAGSSHAGRSAALPAPRSC
jgi:hypothetical protein